MWASNSRNQGVHSPYSIDAIDRHIVSNGRLVGTGLEGCEGRMGLMG